MSKSWRRDSKNDNWRKAKMNRERQKGGGRPFNREDEAEQLRRDEKNGLYGGVEDIAN